MLLSRQYCSRLALGLLLAAVAGVSACDRITEPSSSAKPADLRPAAIEGDTLQCRSGWEVIQGRYVCNEEG